MASIYTLLAITGSSLLVIILRIIKARGLDSTMAVTVNFAVAGAITMAFGPNGVDHTIAGAPWLWMAVLSGVSFMATLLVNALSVARAGVAITTISWRAAMAIPVVFAFVVLGEEATAMKIVLLIVLAFSLGLMLSGGSSVEPGPGGKAGGGERTWLSPAVMLPVAVFILGGVGDTMIQYSRKRLVTDDESMLFISVVSFFAFVCGVAVWLWENRHCLRFPSGKTIMWGVALGAANGVCFLGMMQALATMEASLFYPLYYAGGVVVSTVVGVLAFREHLTVRNYAGIAVALAAIVLLAIQ